MKNSNYNTSYEDDGSLVICGTEYGSSKITRLEFDRDRQIKSVIISPKYRRQYTELMSLYDLKAEENKDGEKEFFNYQYLPQVTVLEALFELDESLIGFLESKNSKLKEKNSKTIPIAKIDKYHINNEKYEIEEIYYTDDNEKNPQKYKTSCCPFILPKAFSQLYSKMKGSFMFSSFYIDSIPDPLIPPVVYIKN